MSHRYVKLDQAHAGYSAALASCRSAFEGEYPSNTLSVVSNPLDALCWVKTTTATDLTLGGAVLDIQDGSNSRARDDVAAWFSVQEP